GKETGQHLSHYVIAGGVFEQSYDRLAATNWRLNLESAHRSGGQKGPRTKMKFTCPSCGENVWGKPSTRGTCTPCGLEMHSIEPSNEKIIRDSAVDVLCT